MQKKSLNSTKVGAVFVSDVLLTMQIIALASITIHEERESLGMRLCLLQYNWQFSWGNFLHNQ